MQTWLLPHKHYFMPGVIWWLMVYVTAWACWKGYRSLKNDRGDFREGIGIFAVMCVSVCVPEIRFNEGEDNLNMSLWVHPNTHTHNITLFPLICHLCASQQKTFLQDRTGHWELWDLQGLRLHHLQVRGWMQCVNFCIFIACFYTWVGESAVHVSAHGCVCVHHAVILNHVSFREFSFYGLVGLSFCSVWQWQHRRMQALRVWPLVAGLITEHSYKRLIKTYHTHSHALA